MYWGCLLIVVLSFCVRLVDAQCQDRCSKNGICNVHAQCECFPGYKGSKCSVKTCPTGRRFADIAYKVDQAHEIVECSGQGTCNSDGRCDCYSGWGGARCDRRECPNNCNHRGTCMTLRDAAREYNGWSLNHSTTYTAWDADSTVGCFCDPGYAGYDCSKKLCDYGVDPRDPSPYRGYEKVHLVCECSGAACGGKFKMRFKGRNALTYLTDESVAADVVAHITSTGAYYSQTTAYGATAPIIVTVGGGGASTTLCASSTTRVTEIQFLRNTGDMPALSFSQIRMGAGSVFFQTTQYLECDCVSTTCEGKFQVGYEGEFTSRLSITSAGSTLITALSNLQTISSSGITLLNTSYTTTVDATIMSADNICQSGVRRNHTIVMKGPQGNLPRLELFNAAHSKNDENIFTTENFTQLMKIYSNDGRDDAVAECNGVGTCDYNTGTCECPYGWEYSATKGPCGAPVVNHSDWPGVTRCPGTVSYPDRNDLGNVRNVEKLYIAINPGVGFNNHAGTLSSIVMYSMTYTGLTDGGDAANYDYEFDYPRVNTSVVKETIYNYTTTTAAGALALDRSRDHLYFSANIVAGYFIGRLVLNTNGTADSSSTWLSVTGAIYDLSLDADMHRRKIFWTIPDVDGTTTANGKIQWEYLDATSPSANDLTSTIGQANLVDPLGLAVHHIDEKIYWVDKKDVSGTTYSVLRSSDFDGSTYAEIIIYDDEDTATIDAKDIVIDFRNNTMYFTGVSSGDSASNHTIYQTDIDFPTYMWQNYNGGWINETDNSQWIIKKIRSSNHLTIDNPAYLTLEFDSRILLWSDPDLYSVKFMDVDRDGNNTGIDQYSGTVWNFNRNYMPDYLHLVENWEKPWGIVVDYGLTEPRDGRFFDCFGNGRCTGATGNFKCDCDPGFYGNCKLRSCPTGPAWFHEPIVDGYAHDINVECSNAGVCDSSTGQCKCDDGYEGWACERSKCQNECNGNGRCFSMRKLAAKRKSLDLESNGTIYGKFYHDQLTWDADMVHGCYADEYGYSESIHNITSYAGYQMNELECPYGYDKRLADSANTSISVPSAITLEVQSMKCSASSGTFTVTFRGQTSSAIAFDATATVFEDALESLSTIGDVTIMVSNTNTGSGVCDAASNNLNITFNTELGEVPMLTANNGLVNFAEVVASGGALLECSGRGDCNRVTGQCECWDQRVSSDGKGLLGTRGDCGHFMMN
mmetsp:Transcript_3943/g.6672  ORF Transcript_3943/g.6672 Transcript_3943/m.6672 type:complete len:1204 (-) Transcript_3943:99-3710(-)